MLKAIVGHIWLKELSLQIIYKTLCAENTLSKSVTTNQSKQQANMT